MYNELRNKNKITNSFYNLRSSKRKNLYRNLDRGPSIWVKDENVLLVYKNERCLFKEPKSFSKWTRYMCTLANSNESL
jgi:hypothetical protein